MTLMAAVGLHSVGLGFPLLTTIVVLPLIGALVITLGVTIEFTENASRKIARLVAGLTALLVVFLLLAFNDTNGTYQFTSQHKWLSTFGADWKLAVDGVSLFAVVVTGLLFAAVMAVRNNDRPSAYYAWILLLESACLGTLLSADLFLFFVCFQLVLVPLYFLTTGWGGADREGAALRFFVTSLLGSALLLVSMLAVVFIVARNTGNAATFDLATLEQAHVLSVAEGRWLVLGFAAAFALRSPIFPFHWAWADVYEQAPRALVIVIAGVVANLGTYGFVRFGVALFPRAGVSLAPVFMTLGVVGTVFAAAMIVRQRNIRRIAAYLALGQGGIVLLGAFSTSKTAVEGAVILAFTSSLSIAVVLLGLTLVHQRTPIVNVSQLIGLRRTAPVLFGSLVVAMFSAIGVPVVAAFVGDYHVFQGALDAHRWWGIAGIVAAAVLAVATVFSFRRLFSGEAAPVSMTIRDLSGRERFVLVPLVLLLVFVGVYPRPVLDRVQPAVARIVALEATK